MLYLFLCNITKLNIIKNIGNKNKYTSRIFEMENEIVTPSAGTVASVNVTKGQTVASGDVLITVAE